jgi:acyl phosphate:glycerol-3-phosphate acyltransferase
MADTSTLSGVELTLVLALAYLLGSIPGAFLVARTSGVDLRRRGSGNVGATNVLRTLGVSRAVVAMCLDAAKGSVAVAVASSLSPVAFVGAAAGVCSVLGHVFPVWLGFRGGKGVATAAGVFAVLAPLTLLASGVVFVVTVWYTRFISVGSLVGTATLAAGAAASGPTATAVAAAVVTVIILVRHRDNVRRVVDGTERRIGLRGA